MAKRTMDTGNKRCKQSTCTHIPSVANLNRYNINSNYGTAADLLALSEALHDRGMYLMVDVVANHMVGLFEDNISAKEII
jgi:maltooligosyltrehalose synthase